MCRYWNNAYDVIVDKKTPTSSIATREDMKSWTTGKKKWAKGWVTGKTSSLLVPYKSSIEIEDSYH